MTSHERKFLWLEVLKTLGVVAAIMAAICLVLGVRSALAATPMDGMFLGVLGSLPLWGQVMVGLGGLGLAGGALAALHYGPSMLVGIVIGFAVLVLIVAATGGSLFSWLQSVVG